MTIFIGTAGWSYPRGAGKWDGVFYPPRLATAKKLGYYAERFNAVEVNSSFYRPLDPKVVRGWSDSTPDGFHFCIKLFNKFTHPRMFSESSGGEATLTDADYDQARAGLEPLASGDKLGALLAQFPPSFKAAPDNISHLEQLMRRLKAYPLAVELRHRSWSDDPETRALLEEYQAAWVMIDEPKFKTSVRHVPLTSRLGYFRFHGRNYEQWWRGDNETRYNYLYTPREQAALAADVQSVAAETSDTYVFYNNHYRAKAVVNALQLGDTLGQPTRGALSQELLEEYPELAELTSRR